MPRNLNPTRYLVALLIGLALTACTPTGTTSEAQAPTPVADLSRAAPEAVGLSSERLERLSAAMQGLVDEGRLAGITTLIARHGKVAHFGTFGAQDMEAGKPMAEDTIFRIYSMTKPVTSVALMLLYEEGRFRLSDPVEKYIPEFKDLPVAVGEDENGIVTEPADHPMTIRELMSHTAGLSYGIFSESPVDKLYREAEILHPDSTLRDMIEDLAAIPLRQQPGTVWHYSVAVDVQGYLVEVLSGQPFDEFLKERIFDPLGMKDTGFWVPPEKADRFAQVYVYDENGALMRPEGEPMRRKDFLSPVNFPSGGGGLVSTTMDYARFCQMLLNGGTLDGVRLLAPSTVAMMHRNQMPRGVPEYSRGRGFGLNFGVVLDPVEADGISKGEYYWGGIAGTWFWIDPLENLIFVGMIQQFGENRPHMRSLSRRLTYQAIVGDG
ncbi:MAG: serine hydrolase [Gammaproteobacteria bacterium]|nr:serine hydrolase [Gammaproteobacteria bacterium]MDD9960852.1 serine hydrolase [Gammaproteobacteria bacterium]MDE0272571.1 serine hydrolase [Gammaproteobacteria bacterium]